MTVADTDELETAQERFSDNPTLVGQLDRLADVQRKLVEIEIADGTDEDDRRHRLLGLIDRLLLALSVGDPMLYGDQFVTALSAQIDAVDQNVSTYSCTASGDPVPALTEFVRSTFVPDATAAAAQLAGVSEHAARMIADAYAQLTETSGVLASIADERQVAAESLKFLTTQAAEQLDADRAAQHAALAKLIEDAATDLETDRVEFAKACELLDREGDELIARLRQQLALSADYRLSAQYEHQAKSEEDHADRMRRLAFGWGAAAAVVAAISLGLMFIGAAAGWEMNSWALLPSKITVIAALAGLAGYSGGQSSRHRNAARQLRTTQLELANLGAYIEELPTDQRAEVRRELVPSFFGKTVVAHPDDGPSTAALGRQLASSHGG